MRESVVMESSLSPREHTEHDDNADAGARTKKDAVVVLIVPSSSYRTADFVDAARALRVDLIVATDASTPTARIGASRTLTIDFSRQEWSAARIANLQPKPDAVVSADDRGVVIAALASDMLSLVSNPVAAVSATRDKAAMRALLFAADVPQPSFARAGAGEVGAVSHDIGYPCVVKPLGLSGSRGVIRVDHVEDAEAAEGRIRAIVGQAGGNAEASLLVESFVDGPEIAVEGMLVDGELHILALLDKPDPMDGPYFEETMFVTPSRHPQDIQHEIVSVVQAATDALGLVTGPIHAEVRSSNSGVKLIEIAARSIGGLCGRSLSFGLLGESLELLILSSALGLPLSGSEQSQPASGVLMIPIPYAGRLEQIANIPTALSVPGVTDFAQTISDGKTLTPLPEGERYLGFLFAEGLTPESVESSLRTANNLLDVVVNRTL